MRGQKKCEQCGTTCGPRTKVCKECGHTFSFKPVSRERKSTKIIRNFPWRDLQKGDIIKTSGGPYYLSENGDTLSMGCRGKHQVIGIDNKGILAWGIGKSGNGFCHIYMGKDYSDNGSRYVKTKHRVHKLKAKEGK
jgi:hypothetical protein